MLRGRFFLQASAPARRGRGRLAARRGAVLMTETILWVTILSLSLAVGLVGLRMVSAGFFHDEVHALAAHSNAFEFDTLSSFYCEQATPNWSFLFGGLSDQADPPQPLDAQPEGS